MPHRGKIEENVITLENDWNGIDTLFELVKSFLHCTVAVVVVVVVVVVVGSSSNSSSSFGVSDALISGH